VAKSKTANAKQKQENAIIRYFRETWFELKKVSWPTRREALNLTIVVVIVATFMSIVLSLMDWLFSTAFRLFI
jgi:preprotein translocase subunit SecE